MYYVSVDVCQTEIASLMTECQAFVVDAEEMKTCCMKVVNVDFVFGNPETELISRPVGEATFHATTCHPDTKTFFVMVSAGSSFLAGPGAMFLNHRCTTEFAAPDHKCFVQQAALFQILNECGTGLVDFVDGTRQGPVNRLVMVPSPGENLYETNSFFHQPPREQTVTGDCSISSPPIDCHHRSQTQQMFAVRPLCWARPDVTNIEGGVVACGGNLTGARGRQDNGVSARMRELDRRSTFSQNSTSQNYCGCRQA